MTVSHEEYIRDIDHFEVMLGLGGMVCRRSKICMLDENTAPPRNRLVGSYLHAPPGQSRDSFAVCLKTLVVESILDAFFAANLVVAYEQKEQVIRQCQDAVR